MKNLPRCDDLHHLNTKKSRTCGSEMSGWGEKVTGEFGKATGDLVAFAKMFSCTDKKICHVRLHASVSSSISAVQPLGHFSFHVLVPLALIKRVGYCLEQQNLGSTVLNKKKMNLVGVRKIWQVGDKNFNRSRSWIHIFSARFWGRLRVPGSNLGQGVNHSYPLAPIQFL